MAANSKTPQDISTDQLAEAVARGITAAQGPKKLTPGQYAKRERERNPKPALKRPVYQNGYSVDVDSGAVTAEAITLMNRITTSGRYLGRRVEVIVRNDPNDKAVEIRYPNKSIDQRMENAQFFTSFTDLVRKIVAEQDDLKAKRKARGLVEEDEESADATAEG